MVSRKWDMQRSIRLIIWCNLNILIYLGYLHESFLAPESSVTLANHLPIDCKK